ncbi:MAG: hypothetical protein CM1200mP14_22730 [Gammaproteobacteria bacterium]|nr:MAG: hypothetical protein CM1200mP14_22730 [Gammaproteobacteria bacterium]
MSEKPRIAVIGAGAWGTALGMLLAEKDKFTVTMWSFEADVADSINEVPQKSVFAGDTFAGRTSSGDRPLKGSEGSFGSAFS